MNKLYMAILRGLLFFITGRFISESVCLMPEEYRATVCIICVVVIYSIGHIEAILTVKQ